MQQNMNIKVKASRPYEISLHNNAFEQFGAILKAQINANAILIFDTNISEKFKNSIIVSFEKSGIVFSVLTLARVGEEIKTIAFFEEFCQNLLSNFAITRKTTLIAIGGGTVGDFIGFVAATLMRGMPFIQVPTTLLSMVDSSVGGKVAVNVGKIKNAVGCFYQPKHVLIDIAFLKTLPTIELISGYAEVLKYGFIADKNFYEYLLKNACDFIGFLNVGEIDDGIEKYLMAIGISQRFSVGKFFLPFGVYTYFMPLNFIKEPVYIRFGLGYNLGKKWFIGSFFKGTINSKGQLKSDFMEWSLGYRFKD
jgi:3-dehydroquinate synthetase